ncbi:MAG: DUF4176 domain-containing protein [Bacilli bacterium]|nr:DUF4176 domain-containing protein [Bacilli bacterium]
MKYEKYLPIGTVVLLKGGTKRVMITGFCVMSSQNNKIYDYTGCLYPEGYVSQNNVMLFDHNQIDKIYYLGLSDNEEKMFKQKLNEVINESVK